MEKPKLLKDLGIVRDTNGKYLTHYGIYECPYCGKEFKAAISNVNFRHTGSCGCNHFKSQFKHGMSNTKLYNVWRGMMQRCKNIKTKKYKHYGGKGVIVCDEWKNDFMVFYQWCMDNGYIDPGKNRTKIVIDRIDNDGNYEPGNCRFLTYSKSEENTSLLRSDNTTGFRGVYKVFGTEGKWYARIKCAGIYYFLGTFFTPEQAAQAYNDFVIEHKTFHPLNIIRKP